jgi:uncharacterized protein (UPF0276 family)
MTAFPNISGIGLRLAHLSEIVATRPRCGWLEIHPENFLANPHAKELLASLSSDYRISLHTVGISVGTASGIDEVHLRRIRDLANAIHPVFVSGHLAWSSYRNEYLNDLLPLPYSEETLEVVVRHVDQVQNALSRPYLIENPASYVGFRSSTIPEAEFLGEVVARTGCQLLCDVSNIVVSAHNMGYDPHAYIDTFPADEIAEIHLGGYTAEEDEAGPGAEVLIDTHAAPIAAPAWDLYRYALRRFGPKPTLIEWDNDMPPLTTLLGEAARAGQIQMELCHAAAH